MIFHVLWQSKSGINPFFQFCVSYIASHDDGSGQREAGGNRILAQRFQNFGHGLVEVYFYSFTFALPAVFFIRKPQVGWGLLIAYGMARHYVKAEETADAFTAGLLQWLRSDQPA